MKVSRLISFLLWSATALQTSRACDICGSYTPQLETQVQLGSNRPAHSADPMSPWTRGVYGAVGEQFTHFGTLQFSGSEVDDPADQRLESSITQLVAGYHFNDRFALQVNVPLIARYYKRAQHFDIDRGHVSGLGDISLIGKFVLFRTSARERNSGAAANGKQGVAMESEPDFAATAVLLGGIKFPTGDASRLQEEFHEHEHEEGVPESGIHGHDLALGSGSYDAIVGLQAAMRYQRFFLEADVQFTLRGDGRYSYHYANDLSWSGGPGFYVIRSAESVLGLQCVISGESKNTDRFQGRVAEDTGLTSLFIGPRILGSVGRFSGEIGVGIPVLMNSTKLQIVPDYRINAGVSVQF